MGHHRGTERDKAFNGAPMLTDAAIRKIVPTGKRFKVFDGQGLFLEVLPSGIKKWRIRWRWHGQEQTAHTLGTYPYLSLKEARAQNAAFRLELQSGHNPLENKTGAPKPPSHTFKSVADEWLERNAKTWVKKYQQAVTSRVNRYLVPHFGAMAIDNISAQDVLYILRAIEDSGHIQTALRVKVICSQIFKYGVISGYCPSDPCRDLSGALMPYKAVHRAAITLPSEVGQLMASLHSYRGFVVTKYALLWLAYTFCRPVEVREAVFSEIDDDAKEWRIPAERMKMRRPHRVPLPRQCLVILAALRQWKFSDTLIFPSPYHMKATPLSSTSLLVALQKTLGYGKAITAHGFRAMAKTLLEEVLDYDSKLIEVQLSHLSENAVAGAYNRASYLRQRRRMMQAYADYLDELAEQASPGVTAWMKKMSK